MSDRSVGALAAATAAALFGSAYVATAFQLHGFSPLGAAMWRAGLACLVLAALQVALRLRARAPGTAAPADLPGVVPLAGRLWRLLAIGLAGGLVFMIGMNLAVSGVGPTVSSFVAGLYAITGALFAPLVLGERLERRTLLGFVVALVGTAMLAELGPSATSGGGLAAGLLAAVSYGLYLNLVRRWSRRIRVGPVGISLTAAAVTAAGLAILLAVTDPASLAPRALPPETVVATAWLATVTAIGPLLTTISVRRVEAALASSMLLVNPITATVLSALLLGERPSAVQLLGGLLTLVGMGVATGAWRLLAGRRARGAPAAP